MVATTQELTAIEKIITDAAQRAAAEQKRNARTKVLAEALLAQAQAEAKTIQQAAEAALASAINERARVVSEATVKSQRLLDDANAEAERVLAKAAADSARIREQATTLYRRALLEAAQVRGA